MSSARRALAIGAGGLVATVVAWALLRDPTLPAGVVLRIDERDYTAARLARELPDAAWLSTEQAEARVRAFADRELVAREASKRGIPPGTALWELARDRVQPVTDADLRRAYRARRAEFRHPRRVLLAYAAVPRGDESDAARLQIEAVRVRAQLHPAPGRERSWVPRRMANGVALQTGPLPCEGDPPRGSALTREVLEVACSLHAGELSSPIETERAWFLVKPIHFEPARDFSLREARGALQRVLENDARDRAQLSVMLALRRDAEVVVSRRALRAWLDDARASAPAPPTAPYDRPPQPPGASPGGST